jgi:hypothetical protein
VIYEPPEHLAVYVGRGALAAPRDVAFWVAAVNQQIREHVAPVWGLPPMGVAYYGEIPTLPEGDGAMLGIVNDDGNAESAGWHAAIGRFPFGLVDLGQSRRASATLSHEALEIFVNAYLDRWIPNTIIPGRSMALEICDPVQERTYPVRVSIMGETRDVLVSDFVTPAWFGVRNADGSHARTYMSDAGQALELAPFTNATGGYYIAQERGETIYVQSFAQVKLGASLRRRSSRTAQIASGVRVSRRNV